MMKLIVTCLLLGFCSPSRGFSEVLSCYEEETSSCGPYRWGVACKDGKKQSPIHFPGNMNPAGSYHLRMLNAYIGPSFRMQNNGHTLIIDFGDTDTRHYYFPNSASVIDPVNPQYEYYKFASVHFHWGTGVGSEHCVEDECFAMEAHFVHYGYRYDNLTHALNSGSPNALAVLGVLINMEDNASLTTCGFNTRGSCLLTPIVDNLDKVREADAHNFVKVDKAIDLSSVFAGVPNAFLGMYSYEGSLTTPGCQEQVAWFVLKRPINVPKEHVNAFRTKLFDSGGVDLIEDNRRPRQNLNQRTVLFNMVYPGKIAKFVDDYGIGMIQNGFYA